MAGAQGVRAAAAFVPYVRPDRGASLPPVPGLHDPVGGSLKTMPRHAYEPTSIIAVPLTWRSLGHDPHELKSAPAEQADKYRPEKARAEKRRRRPYWDAVTAVVKKEIERSSAAAHLNPKICDDMEMRRCRHRGIRHHRVQPHHACNQKSTSVPGTRRLVLPDTEVAIVDSRDLRGVSVAKGYYRDRLTAEFSRICCS